MALTKLSRQISEASARTPTIGSPVVSAASQAGRKGWVPGIPIGGSTDNNPGQSTVAGALTRQNWMSQLFQSYLACTWVSDCVDVIARTITAGGVQVVPNNLSLEGEEIPEPPEQVKAVQALLEYVNEEEDMRQLMREVVIDLLVFGDSFTEVVYLNQAPIALFPLDPQTMDILSDEHGTCLGYHQRMETGREAWFEPHQVIHVKMDAPGGGLYGVSDVQKNYVPITNYLFTEGLIQETMKRGDPSRLHVDWPIALPITVQQRLAQAYQFTNLGAKNIGNLFETKGQTAVQELGQNKLKDWDMVATACRDEIISGFGVPPSKVGVIESANIGGGQGTSQDRSFRVNTCGPISELILEKFSFRLLYLSYGVKDWHLKFGEVDWRDDMTIEQIRDMRIRNGLWTVNRGRTDIGEPPIEGGDVPVLVDRQNLVAWRDMGQLSSANLEAIQAAADAQKAGGAAGAAGATPNPTSPKPPKGSESDDDHSPFDHLAYRDAFERYSENRQARILEENWRGAMAFELKEAPFHPHYGYNSPHLPLGTDPDYVVAPVFHKLEVEDPEGESKDSEPVILEDPVADAEPVDAENHEIMTPDKTHSPDEIDLVPLDTIPTQDPEALAEGARIEEVQTSMNEYRSDDPLQVDGLPADQKDAKLQEFETSVNDYRADEPEDHIETEVEPEAEIVEAPVEAA